MRFEHERLWRAGKRKLAECIDHVAKTKGDGLGYGIRSFAESGEERFIEVKTTRYGSLTPFFASGNEGLKSRLPVMAADKVPPPQNTSIALNGGFALRLRRM